MEELSPKHNSVNNYTVQKDVRETQIKKERATLLALGSRCTYSCLFVDIMLYNWTLV